VITALQNGTLVPLKAIQDQNGNVIDTTYATKTELSAEATARTNADSNLQQQINQHDSRIKNLEEKAGDYTTVQYRGTNAVPTGKASYGLVEKIVGVTRADNQLCQNPMFTDSVSGWDPTRGTMAYDNGRYKYTITDMSGSDNLSHRISRGVSFVKDHVYLIAFDITSPRNGNGCCDAYNAGIGYNWAFPFSANVRTQVQRIATATTTVYAALDIGFGGYDSQYGYQVGDVIYFDNVIVRDLTQYFGGNIPAGLDLDMVRQNYPSLLIPSAYNAGSLVSTTVNGVESKSRNVFDEELELGTLSTTTGAEQGSSTQLRAVNYISILPSTTYYGYCTSLDGTSTSNIVCNFYDADKNFISFGGLLNGASVTSPPNAFYMRIWLGSTYGTTPLNDITINVSDSNNGTYTPWFEPKTLSLPSVTLRSAGTVAEEYDLESGKVTHPIDSYTFDGTETWAKRDTETVGKYFYTITLPVKDFDLYSVPNVTIDSFATVTYVQTYQCVNGCGSTGGLISIYDSNHDTVTESAFASFMSGKTIYFELATPDPSTFVTPILNNTLQTEGGGTINTIQTQTPVIDNCLDVGYLAL